MDKYIIGFKTEQDVRLTLAEMEKQWLKWMWNQLPTQWNWWVRSNWDYNNFSLSYKDGFGQWQRWLNIIDGIKFIDFKEVISKKPVNANANYISWFRTEQDVERTLAVMEQIGWKWLNGILPTKWDGWKDFFRWSKGWSLSNHNGFWQNSIREIDPSDLYFEDFIKMHTTNPAPEKPSTWKIEVTFDNLKNFIWKKFTGIKGGEPIEWVIVDKPKVWVRFNTQWDTWWDANDYPWYRKWWTIIDKLDFDNIEDFMIVSEVEPDPTADIEIPKYFYIKRNESNVLWEEYITWLNKKYSSKWAWGQYNYYGYDDSTTRSGTDCHENPEYFKNNAKEITLEFWNQYMNDINDPELPVTATETTQSYEVPLSKFDSSDPETGVKYPNPYGTRMTDFMKAAAPIQVYSRDSSGALPTIVWSGCSGKAGDIIYVDDPMVAGPYIAPKVPVKKSRYSSMLDLI